MPLRHPKSPNMARARRRCSRKREDWREASRWPGSPSDRSRQNRTRRATCLAVGAMAPQHGWADRGVQSHSERGDIWVKTPVCALDCSRTVRYRIISIGWAARCRIRSSGPFRGPSQTWPVSHSHCSRRVCRDRRCRAGTAWPVAVERGRRENLSEECRSHYDLLFEARARELVRVNLTEHNRRGIPRAGSLDVGHRTWFLGEAGGVRPTPRQEGPTSRLVPRRPAWSRLARSRTERYANRSPRWRRPGG